jgi:uncharacterized membrane protein
MPESTARLEAFSDGVFAIAITLLILEIRLPAAGTPVTTAGLTAALASLWPSYLAFLLSFWVILLMWINHHELLKLAHRVDSPLLLANGLLLLFVTFVPFPTAVLAQHLATPAANAATAFYCATFLAGSAGWHLVLGAIVAGRRASGQAIPADQLAGIRRAYRTAPMVYALSVVAAWWQPALGLLINASLWVVWVRLGYRAKAPAR